MASDERRGVDRRVRVRVEGDTPTGARVLLYCPECGERLRSRFKPTCPHCGARVVGDDA